MLTVRKVADEAGVTPDAVRHHVRIELITPERHRHNGYKLFAETDVRRLRFIRQARRLGFALEESREMFGHAGHGHSPCSRVRGLIEGRIARDRRSIEELAALQSRTEAALKRRKEMPDGHSICHLIESEDGHDRQT